MDYYEASYFDGFHFAHIAAFEALRLVEMRKGQALVVRKGPIPWRAG